MEHVILYIEVHVENKHTKMQLVGRHPIGMGGYTVIDREHLLDSDVRPFLASHIADLIPTGESIVETLYKSIGDMDKNLWMGAAP